MATTRGCYGVIKAGDTPTTVAELTAWDFTETASEIDTSSMGSCTSSSEAGSVKTTGNISFWWDASDGGQDEIVAGATVAIEIYPAGTTVGEVKYSGSVVILSRSVTATTDSVCSSTATFTVNGALTEGVAA